MEAVETEREGPLTLTLHYDETPFDPRENDNVGTMVCWHRRANLGDETVDTEGYNSYEELVKEYAGDNAIVLPLFLYEHSGMTMRVGANGNPFHDPWDSGMVGFIFATREKIGQEFPHPRYDCVAEGCGYYVWGGNPDGFKAVMAEHLYDKALDERGHGFREVPIDQMVREALVAEVEEYDQYLRGDVYGYVIKDEHGENVDSCWGFFGYEYALKEAREQLTAYAELVMQQRAEAEKHATLIDTGDFA